MCEDIVYTIRGALPEPAIVLDGWFIPNDGHRKRVGRVLELQVV